VPLSDLTSREAVVAALEEFDALERDAFLERYGFGRAQTYYVHHDSGYYDAKAIVGAAVGFQHPDTGPMTSTEFSGGEALSLAMRIEQWSTASSAAAVAQDV
jgi:hypothetical protein